MIALVTGATSGIGAAVARRLVREGALVIAAGRRSDRLQVLREALGERLVPLTLDVRDRGAVDAALASLPDHVRAIDVLVNNAGLALGLEPAHAANLESWEAMIETNVTGLVYVTRAVLPAMVERGRGHVVNVGSVAATYAYPGGNVYGATKAFVAQLSRNLRADLSGTPVRVTNVEPGLVGGTEFSVTRFHGDRARADAVYEKTVALTADDVADAIYWAISRPAHVNINSIELMPVSQTPGPLQVARTRGG